MILMNSKSQQPIFFCQSQEEEIVPFKQANDPIELYIQAETTHQTRNSYCE